MTITQLVDYWGPILLTYVKKTHSLILNIVNPLYNLTFGDHFFCLTQMNCDLNVYSHIPYKPLQDCDYRPKKRIYKTTFLS